jgi:hypothetical protein
MDGVHKNLVLTDLIWLLDDPDRDVSLRAQVIIRYLGNEAGMKALRAWYSKQREGYRVAGPVPQPLDDWDYNNIKLNLIGNSPRTWGDEGGFCCKNYFEVRNFFERISLGSNLKQRSNELCLPHRIISC